ncbi:extracellular solute-binding protein [Enterococcus sp. DIV1314a]|uniref:extracellular solute-binding protein n=1 Tax=Enterococcus sp. DIV1314a TaxID=2774660 RepID=UPI003F2176FE
MKKIFKLTIFSALLLTLVACGTKENEIVSNESVDTTNNLYGYDEPIILKVGWGFASDVTWKNGEGPENNDWTRVYEENGYKLETLYSVDSSQSNQKLTTAIASGNYPDIIAGSGNDILKYAKTGVISDITDAYEKYASPELKAYYDGTPGSLDSGKIDGKLYGLPQLENPWNNAMMLFVRQDWLDNLSLSAPTTIDELKEVALAFTKNDPDGNGKDDTYGLALNGKEDFSFWSGMQAFFESYGVQPGHWGGNFPFVENNGVIEWGGANSVVMKKALADLNEMYEVGSLAKGFASLDMNVLMSDVGSGKVGMYFAPHWGAMVPGPAAYLNNENAVLAAVALPDGNGKDSGKPYINPTPKNFYGISSKSNNPEAVIKLANLSVKLLNFPENEKERELNDSISGGIGWKGSLLPLRDLKSEIENQNKVFDILNGKDTELNQSYQQIFEDLELYEKAKNDGTLKDKIKNADPQVSSGFSMTTVYGEYGGLHIQNGDYFANQNAVSEAYLSTPTDTMSNKYATLNPMTLETIVKIISGAAPVDSYDDFLETWKNLGGNEITEEAQEWYDNNNK